MPNWWHEPRAIAKLNRTKTLHEQTTTKKEKKHKVPYNGTKKAATSTNTEHSVNKIKEFKDSN